MNDGAARANRPDSDGGDLDLVAAVGGGDPRAFEQLYRRYQPRLARFVGNLLRSSPAIEEVVNDTLMVVWDRPHSFAGTSKFSTWLFAIAYRKALRARNRRPSALDEPAWDTEPDAAPDHGLARERAHASLLDAMRHLSAEHRAVVDLTYFHDLGYREIAEIMNCPVDTVKTRMFHARRHLRRKLAGNLSDWI
ncbi:sigma-70 family RNA polymerase sigma factor [Sphingomonas sp. GB1N7]